MADADQTREARPTRRAVVKRERVLVLPDGVSLDDLAKAKDGKALAKITGGEKPAWVVLGAASGSPTKAIETFAGTPGTPDAVVGDYRAPSLVSWACGATYNPPLVTRSPLVDELT